MKHFISAKYRCFVLFVEIFLVIFLIPVFYNYIPVSKDASAAFHIDSSNIDDVVSTLEKNGYSVTFIDKLMLKLIKVPEKGWYHVDHNEYGRLLFFATMHHKKTDHTMDIVVYAGETSDELITRLANDMKLDREKLKELYKTFSRFGESDIFAQRYTIARKANEKSTMLHLLSLSNAKLLKFEMENFKQKPDSSTFKTLFTIASIIQKESNSAKEMPLVSSVIYNRLDKNMKLQMDGTLNYGKNSHTIVTPERIRTDTSRYNTYRHKGLPPTPLCSITQDALHAAMHPAKTDYLYFTLKPDGTHTFTSSYDEHLKNTKIFKLYLKEKKKQEALEKTALEKKKKSEEKKNTTEKKKTEKVKEEAAKDQNRSALQ
jgi:UPF0755 protein